METLVRRAHLLAGFTFLVGFVLTGQYMHRVHAHLQGMPDGPRLLYRSAHIYLLFSALLNLLLGAYVQLAVDRLRRALQLAGSIALMATPVLFTLAFFREPTLTGLMRPWARPAIYLSLAAVLMHVAAVVLGRAPDDADAAGAGAES